MQKTIIFLITLLLFSGCKRREVYPEPERDYTTFTQEAKQFAQYNRLSNEFYILVDMSVHSGKKRMFVINFADGSIRDAFLTTHGMGCGSSDGDVRFSNTPESHCSSKGKYILGTQKVYSPGYRYKYIMYGKEASNSNAVVRNVVFHPWSIVPDEETYPNGIAQSWGCPAVSEKAFNTIDGYLQSTNGRVLLWIID
ncbi:murein L,D-transpeptidase catalytic domain-containing protein [Bergeyella porcorum]|uniref:murein L,D-transpeptidase catalytic domain-containing protein n=1 Tax=Bergeyella porcorum TaxID=1735111 RepID=UPI0035EC631A